MAVVHHWLCLTRCCSYRVFLGFRSWRPDSVTKVSANVAAPAHLWFLLWLFCRVVACFRAPGGPCYSRDRRLCGLAAKLLASPSAFCAAAAAKFTLHHVSACHVISTGGTADRPHGWFQRALQELPRHRSERYGWTRHHDCQRDQGTSGKAPPSAVRHLIEPDISSWPASREGNL